MVAKESLPKMSTLEGMGFGDPDLILLEKVTEEAANKNFKLRFEKGKVGSCDAKRFFKCQPLMCVYWCE